MINLLAPSSHASPRLHPDALLLDFPNDLRRSGFRPVGIVQLAVSVAAGALGRAKRSRRHPLT